MALNINSIVLQPAQKRLDLSGLREATARLQQMQHQREQLDLMRQKFEEEKRQAAQQEELRLLEERGRMAREQMQQDRLHAEEEAKAAAVKEAALLAQQQAALGKAGELGGTGKAQQLHAMGPLMDSLGIDQNYIGSAGGLPSYDFVNREQAQQAEDKEFDRRVYHAARPEMEGGERPGFYALPRGIDSLDGSESAVQSLNRLQGLGLGYPTNERGTLEDRAGADRPREEGEGVAIEPQVGGIDAAVEDALSPGEADFATMAEMAGGEEGPVGDVSVNAGGLGPAMLSMGDPYMRALAADQLAKVTKRPARGPDEKDFMGAVPRNRIDMGAMAAETAARLTPALKARVEALPAALQPGAKANMEALREAGFEASDVLKEFDTAMEDPVSIYNKQQEIEAAKAKDEGMTRLESARLREYGAGKLNDMYKDRGIKDSLSSVQKADEVRRVLKDTNRENDSMIASAVMEAQNVVGAPSNTDLEMAFNIPKGSWLTQGLAALQEAIAGGMSDAQKDAILSYMDAVGETQWRNITEFLDNGFDTIDNDRTLDPEERKGFKSQLERSVPGHLYNRYWEAREKREGKGKRGSQAPAPSPGRTGQNEPAAEAELQRQAEASGLNGEVLSNLMAGESGGNPNAANENRTDGAPASSAKGVFQVINETARALGYKDSADYASRPVEEQIEAGLKLFKDKGLAEDSPVEDYALVLAAPAFVGKWKSPDDVIYEVGSDGWKSNPAWRSANDGPATVASITDYYMKAGRARAAALDAADAAEVAKREGSKTPVKGPERKADASNPYANNPKARRALELLESL